MMNQSIATTSAIHQTINHTAIDPQSAPEYLTLDFMMILRILWYVFCLAKIVSIALFSRPKPSIQERVLRKFLMSHNELLRTFTDQDKKSMEQILSNTIKNASSIIDTQNSKIRKTTKRVSFQTSKNNYYEPREWKQEEPVFYDVINTIQSPIKLHETDSFEEKKHQEQFIEREDLLGLNEKSEELDEEKDEEEGSLPLESSISDPNRPEKSEEETEELLS